ncbi:MAG: helix-turn-helix domain-containing protein [Lamprobacter sp.]|uniref:helix-turn-helix domain-containing protein n=1 Tax=Lamprobacter sp. TaxID=3100796 RepID=UPI002B25AA91|nr:helix-turn-helix domain-containing protein [Lamprobacter sp.]MEA3639935.1 helix-turn-helix domain-containing protein [Lamprobacter sp.]
MIKELTERYGLTMTVDDLADVLKMSPKTIRNSISSEQFPIPTYKIGRRRLAKTADVAARLEEPAHG